MKYKLGETGDGLFSSETLSFRITIWSVKMECYINGGKANPFHQHSSFWPMQAPFLVYSDLLLMVGMKWFYRQLSVENFYSSEIVSAICQKVSVASHIISNSHTLSSNEPSSRDDMVSRLEMLIVKWVRIV